MLAEASYRRKATLQTLKAVTERMSELPGQRMVAIMSDGFSLVDIDGARDTDDMNSVVSHAVRSGVVIYTVDTKGLTPPAGFTAANNRSRRGGGAAVMAGNQLDSFNSASEMDSQDVMNAMAHDTGGEAFRNNNDIGGLLKKALDDNQYYYTLAYYPAGESDVKKFRNIVVKVRNHPEYVVRTQKGYSPTDLLKAKADAATTPEQKMFQAIAAPLPVTTLGVAATAEFLGREGDPSQVVLQTFIDGKNIDYREQEQKYHFDLDIATVVYDSTGNPAKTINDKAQGNLQPDRLDIAKQVGFRVTKTLSLKPGLYQIRVGVREPSTERMGTAMARVTVPNLAKNKLAISSVFLGDSSNAPGKTGADSTPSSVLKNGIRFYKPGSTLTYNARLYNVDSTSGHGDGLSVQVEIADATKTLTQIPWSPVNSHLAGKDKSGTDPRR